MPKQKREIKGGSCSCGRGNVEMGISIRAAGGAQPQLLCFFRFCSYFLAFVTPTTRNPSIMQFSIFQQIETELPSPFFFFAGPVFGTTPIFAGRWKMNSDLGFPFLFPALPGWKNIFVCFSIMYIWFVLNLEAPDL